MTLATHMRIGGNVTKKEPKLPWAVERHPGTRKWGWRRAFTGNETPARNQLFLGQTMMSRGGVRLVDPAGVVITAYWKPNRLLRPRLIRFCIGCGCDDLHACVDPLDEETGCSWLVKDRRSATGVCSQCGSALARWRQGERTIRSSRT